MVNCERKFFLGILSKGVNMSCNKLRKQIVLALDGRLDPGPDWQSHLNVCPACRTWLEEQRAVADLLATPVRLEPSPAFAACRAG